MTDIAKLCKNGQSQAVRLPKEFRFENQDEVFINMLLPKHDTSVWDAMFDRLDEFSDDFMQTRSETKSGTSREKLRKWHHETYFNAFEV